MRARRKPVLVTRVARGVETFCLDEAEKEERDGELGREDEERRRDIEK